MCVSFYLLKHQPLVFSKTNNNSLYCIKNQPCDIGMDFIVPPSVQTVKKSLGLYTHTLYSKFLYRVSVDPAWHYPSHTIATQRLALLISLLTSTSSSKKPAGSDFDTLSTTIITPTNILSAFSILPPLSIN